MGRLAESFAAFRDVFRNPNLRRLQLAWVGSVAGQYSFSIAIAVYAYRHGGAASVGAMALVRTIPSAVLAPFVSAAGDRFRQERVMLAADLARALFMAAIALVVFAHGPVAVVFGLAAFGPIIEILEPPQMHNLIELADIGRDIPTHTLAEILLLQWPSAAAVKFQERFYFAGVERVGAVIDNHVESFVVVAVIDSALSAPKRERPARRGGCGQPRSGSN